MTCTFNIHHNETDVMKEKTTIICKPSQQKFGPVRITITSGVWQFEFKGLRLPKQNTKGTFTTVVVKKGTVYLGCKMVKYSTIFTLLC